MFIKLASNAAYLLSALAALSALWRYRRLSPALRLLALLACFDALAETASVLVYRLGFSSNLFLLPAILAGEGLLLTLAYRQALAAPRLGRVLLVVLAAYLAFVLADTWLQAGMVQYHVATQLLTNLLGLALALLYFRQLLHEPRAGRLRRDPFFWLSVGLLVYTLGNLLIALSGDYVLTHFSLAGQQLVLLGVRNVFNIILYAAYIAALWMRPPKTSS